jgi:hypothetical protein
MNRELITITEPYELGCFKPGTVIDTNGYHDPTFMSIGDDQWVNSNNGDIIPNGVLFKLLKEYSAPVVIVDSVYRPTMELLIEISSDHKKSSSRKTKNPFRTSQMY